MSANREGAPPAVKEYLYRCGEQEELVAWWRSDKPRNPDDALWVITFNRDLRRFCVSSFPIVVSHWSHQLTGSNHDPAGMASALQDGLWTAPDSAKAPVREFLASLEVT